MVELYFAKHPWQHRVAISALSAAFMVCWAAAMLGLGGCSTLRELNAHDTRGFWRDQEQKLYLQYDPALAAAMDDLRRH